MLVRIRNLDHLVLTVRDMDRTIVFYTKVLGMREVTFGAGRKALHFGHQKINLHPAAQVIDRHVLHATPGSADLCFILEGSLSEAIADLRAAHVELIDGPMQRTGARGPIQSIYIRDPDENLIELSTYDLTE
jgi:catechol 2,3-dioxygenase-like lactoylglutathione lyase family enzyme